MHHNYHILFFLDPNIFAPKGTRSNREMIVYLKLRTNSTSAKRNKFLLLEGFESRSLVLCLNTQPHEPPLLPSRANDCKKLIFFLDTKRCNFFHTLAMGFELRSLSFVFQFSTIWAPVTSINSIWKMSLLAFEAVSKSLYLQQSRHNLYFPLGLKLVSLD